MARVTGIGGIFLRARDPKSLSAWYAKNLGIAIADYGGATLLWTDEVPPTTGMTIWSRTKSSFLNNIFLKLDTRGYIETSVVTIPRELIADACHSNVKVQANHSRLLIVDHCIP